MKGTTAQCTLALTGFCLLSPLSGQIEIARFELGAQLRQACRQDNVKRVRELIAVGAPIDMKDWGGDTALHEAALRGYLKIVQTLLRAGATVDPQNILGSTPLIWAIQKENVHIVRTLLAAGATPDPPDNQGLSPLSLAAQKGHVEIVRELLVAGVVANQMDSDHTRSPLHLAAGCGHTKVILVLIAAGATVNHLNKLHTTPLYHTAKGGHKATVQALLARGAHPSSDYALLDQNTLAILDENRYIAEQRAEMLLRCLEHNGLPLNLIRLVWNIAGLPAEYRPPN